MSWWKIRGQAPDPDDDVEMPPAPGASAPAPAAPRRFEMTLPESWSQEQTDAFCSHVEGLRAGQSVALPVAEADALRAKAAAHDGAVVARRAEAKRHAVIGMEAAAAERFARMVDQAPEGELLEDLCERARASAEAEAPPQGAARQTAPLKTAETPAPTEGQMAGAKAPDPDAIYGSRRKQGG